MSDRRREPASGYDFPEKAAYREAVWSAIRKALDPVPRLRGGKYFNVRSQADRTRGNVLFLPGREGLEIPVAKRFDFAQHQLLGVEREPDVFRAMTWRKDYKSVECLGVSLSTVSDVTDRKIVAANLDFCSSLGEDVVNELASVWPLRSGDSLVVAFTLMGFRGTGPMNMLVNEIAKQDGWSLHGVSNRLAVVAKAAFRDQVIEPIASGSYKSGSKPVEWGVFQITDKAIVQRQKAKADKGALVEMLRRRNKLAPKVLRSLRLLEIAQQYRDRPDDLRSVKGLEKTNCDRFFAKRAQKFEELFEESEREIENAVSQMRKEGLPVDKIGWPAGCLIDKEELDLLGPDRKWAETVWQKAVKADRRVKTRDTMPAAAWVNSRPWRLNTGRKVKNRYGRFGE